MSPQDDETRFRNRFIALNLVRIGGTVLVLFALLVWQTDRILPEPNLIGLPLALIGLVISFFGPKWLAGWWRRRDGR